MGDQTTPSASTSIEQHQPAQPSSINKKDATNITVEFTGGLELLFSNIQSHRITLPSSSPTISTLITHLVNNLITDSRRDLFVLPNPALVPDEVEGSEDAKWIIRPGILVLVNDADWELVGEESCELKEGDEVLFVSTLHGG